MPLIHKARIRTHELVHFLRSLGSLSNEPGLVLMHGNASPPKKFSWREREKWVWVGVLLTLYSTMHTKMFRGMRKKFIIVLLRNVL